MAVQVQAARSEEAAHGRHGRLTCSPEDFSACAVARKLASEGVIITSYQLLYPICGTRPNPLFSEYTTAEESSAEAAAARCKRPAAMLQGR